MPDAVLHESLRREVREGRCVLIAGTGISLAASENPEVDGCRVASWPGLIRHGIRWCESRGYCDDAEAQLLTNQVNSGRTPYLISAAQRITEILRSQSAGIYRRWLRDTVGSLRVSRPETILALASLPGMLVTLNYDSLIEQATRRQAVTWLDEDKVQDMLRGERPDAVLHLHGYFDEPSSVVLGLESYISVRDSAHTRSVLQAMTLGRTLVFIGCAGTLEDPNFSRLVEWGHEALKNSPHRHFVLCRDEELPAIRALTRDAPWLFALGYGPGHGDLLPFLQGLLAEAAQAPADIAAPAGTPATVSAPAASVPQAPLPTAPAHAQPVAPDPGRVEALFRRLEGADLRMEQRFALANAIAGLPNVTDTDRRNAIVAGLGSPIAGSVSYAADARSHVLNIVNTCLAYEGGMTGLYRALLQFYGGSIAMTGVIGAVERISAGL